MKQNGLVENKVDVVDGAVQQTTSEEVTERIRKPVETSVHEAFDVGDVEVARVTPAPFKRWS